MKNYHNIEIETHLKEKAKNIPSEKSEKLKKYIGTELSVFGLDSKTQVNCVKNGFSFFTDNKIQNFKTLNTIYLNSSNFEVKNTCFIYLDKNYKHIDADSQFNILPKWVKTIDNWAHSDSLSKYLTRLLEHPNTKDSMTALILKWNTSKNLWERRQSLIALFYYARTKKQYIEFDFAQKLILNLINDKEYYVQKAVGWALRECHTVYPKQTYLIIENYISQITPTAFTTCIEKMSEAEKNKLKLKRRKK